MGWSEAVVIAASAVAIRTCKKQPRGALHHSTLVMSGPNYAIHHATCLLHLVRRITKLYWGFIFKFLKLHFLANGDIR